MATPELPPKKDVMLALLERSSVFIHLDPRNEDVRVPAWFKKQPQLVLQVGLNMAVRIPDLDVGDDAVGCTLSFSRSPFYCYVPWTSVFALVADDGKGMLWPNDVPKEVAAQQAEQSRKEQAKSHMRSVPSEPTPESQKQEAAAGGEEAPKADAKIVADVAAEKAGTGRSTSKKRNARLRAEKSSAPGEPRQPRQEAAPGPERPAAGRDSRDSKRPLPPYLRIVK